MQKKFYDLMVIMVPEPVDKIQDESVAASTALFTKICLVSQSYVKS